MSWPTVDLGDLGIVFAGGTPSRGNSDFWGKGVKWLSIRDYKDFDVVTRTKEQITNEGLVNSSAKLFDKGSVIISIFATLGRVAILGEDMATNQAIAAIKCHDFVDNKYLMYALKAQLSHIERQSGGVAQKNINLSILKGLKIPLPPLETQKKIAAVLEKADQLRKDCQQMEQELNSLAQSVFIDMFGDPVTNPKRWDKVPLSTIIDDFLGGKSLVAADDLNTEFKNRVLKISAVTSGEFKPTESKPLPNDYEPQSQHFIKAGDLLFSRANTTDLVGATTMVFNEHTGLVLPDKLWRFIPMILQDAGVNF